MTTDTERLDALANWLNCIVLYEDGRHRIEFKARAQKGRKAYGCKPDFLRGLADGLLRKPASRSSDK